MPQLVNYMIDIAMGMQYISERGLVHRVSEGWVLFRLFTVESSCMEFAFSLVPRP